MRDRKAGTAGSAPPAPGAAVIALRPAFAGHVVVQPLLAGRRLARHAHQFAAVLVGRLARIGGDREGAAVEPVLQRAGGGFGLGGFRRALARQLGGIREEINYTRQWDAVNQARSGEDTIYSYESLMADGIGEEDRSYTFETRIRWGEEQPAGVGPEHGSEPWEYVPSGYDVALHEDGEQIVEDHLPNYPEGATFPR